MKKLLPLFKPFYLLFAFSIGEFLSAVQMIDRGLSVKNEIKNEKSLKVAVLCDKNHDISVSIDNKTTFEALKEGIKNNIDKYTTVKLYKNDDAITEITRNNNDLIFDSLKM